MVTLTNLAETAALVGDPARAAMLFALLDGRAFTAGELARVAGVAAPTASGHLGRLEEAAMLAVERQGRHRYYRLASPEIAAILEGLLLVTEHRTSELNRRLGRPGPRDSALRRARVCYDHLAGELGVALFKALVDREALLLSDDGAALTASGEILMAELGVPLAVAGGRRGRAVCRPCLDWSERRHHLAGPIGAAFLTTALDRGWLRRRSGTRALDFTRDGASILADRIGVRVG